MNQPLIEHGVCRLATPEEEQSVLEEVRLILQGYEIEVELFPPHIMSKGNQGDAPTYTRVLCLKGKHPGDKKLAELSTLITNKVFVNKVTFEILDMSKKS